MIRNMCSTRELRLRISWNPWLTSGKEVYIINELREMLRNKAQLVEHRRLGEKLLKIIGGGKTAYLRKPTEQHPDWDFDVGPIRRTWKDEFSLKGEPLPSNAVFFASWHKPPIPYREAVAVVNIRKFEALPEHIQHLLNIAWMGLKQDRRVRSTALPNGFSLFLLSATDDTPALARMEAAASGAFRSTEIGYVSTDNYEIHQLKKILDLKDAIRCPK